MKIILILQKSELKNVKKMLKLIKNKFVIKIRLTYRLEYSKIITNKCTL